jgi:hypothetical protein
MLCVCPLPQQLLNERDAFAALRLFTERTIDHRYRTAVRFDMGAKVAFSDAVAETDVHSCPYPKFTVFIYAECERLAIAAVPLHPRRVELPHRWLGDHGIPSAALVASHHEYV